MNAEEKAKAEAYLVMCGWIEWRDGWEDRGETGASFEDALRIQLDHDALRRDYVNEYRPAPLLSVTGQHHADCVCGLCERLRKI